MGDMEVLPDLMPQEPLRSVRFSESNTVIPTPLESNSSSETVGSGATSESTEMEQEGMESDSEEDVTQFLITGASTIDIDAYPSIYRGTILLRRLKFIIDHSAESVYETTQVALKTVKSTYNVEMYRQLHAILRKRFPERDHGFSEGWIATVTSQVATITDRLENDIKQYKNSAIKESIKRGYEELAEHKIKAGDLTGALKCYYQSRDYCLQPTHIRNMCLNVITTSVLLGNYAHVASYSEKLKSQKAKECQDTAAKGKMIVANALGELQRKNYLAASNQFLLVDFESFHYPELISPKDLGMYGALLNLALKTRKELKETVINGASFKLFLELEPNMREAIIAFVESKYSDALKYLELQRNILRLDYFMSPHVEYLYSEIRTKCLIHYLKPYQSAIISKMSNFFDCDEDVLIDEVIQLIMSGRIEARVDYAGGLIIQEPRDMKESALKSTIEAQDEFINASRHIILRSKVAKSCLAPFFIQKTQLHSRGVDQSGGRIKKPALYKNPAK
ncbi:Oidioi.mRNA.OKI2018_I69.chr2.g6394.t1.cds [Oikopleura dioica]|uniref:Oidioi.mRNA.OKI2018_I69.chr2.g6394.t1.cds n=1 Tax=Oikopleura dioica TaxID=34765 RepID=A0ABN7T7Q4_OIKDI|nr:Oidioi.mRNA.OKI2018_I69.chr2.g6394.t1.cds [Oikopleura dioica]